MEITQAPTLDRLEEFERNSWPVEYQASREELSRRLDSFPQGIFLLAEQGVDVSQVTVSPKTIPPRGIVGFEQMRDVPVDAKSKMLWITNLATRQGLLGKGHMSKLFSYVINWAKAEGYESIVTGVTCHGLGEALGNGITPEAYMARGMNPATRSLEKASKAAGSLFSCSSPVMGYWEDDKESGGYGVIVDITLSGKGTSKV